MRSIHFIIKLSALVFLVFACSGIASAGPSALDNNWLDSINKKETINNKNLFLNDVSGYIELAPRIYVNDRGAEFNDDQLLISAEMEMSFSVRHFFNGYIRPRLWGDIEDTALKRFELMEAYITYEQAHWDVRLGQFVENWGITDTFNPIDILNRRDLTTSLLDTTRLGESGVRARWLFEGNSSVGEPTISLYFLPIFQATRFAPEQQRLSLSGETFLFRENKENEPKGNEAYFYALRYQSTLNTSFFNADLQWALSKGPNKTPIISAVSPTVLVPNYYGARILGLGIKAVPNADKMFGLLQGTTLKLEVAFNDPYEFTSTDTVIPDKYMAYVFGFDQDLYNVINNQDQLTFTVEFATESGDEKKELSRPFSDDVITRIFWQAGDFARSSFEIRGLFDTDSSEYAIETTFSTSLLSWHQDLKLEVSVLYLHPTSVEGSAFGHFPDNNSIAAKLRFDF